jgi:hypothetical protein
MIVAQIIHRVVRCGRRGLGALPHGSEARSYHVRTTNLMAPRPCAVLRNSDAGAVRA